MTRKNVSSSHPCCAPCSDAELAHHVRRLQQDHGWLEEDWRVLRPQLEAIAEGQSWYEPEMLRQGCEVFAALYLEHIALEESLIYPASKQKFFFLLMRSRGVGANKAQPIPASHWHTSRGEGARGHNAACHPAAAPSMPRPLA